MALQKVSLYTNHGNKDERKDSRKQAQKITIILSSSLTQCSTISSSINQSLWLARLLVWENSASGTGRLTSSRLTSVNPYIKRVREGQLLQENDIVQPLQGTQAHARGFDWFVSQFWFSCQYFRVASRGAMSVTTQHAAPPPENSIRVYHMSCCSMP